MKKFQIVRDSNYTILKLILNIKILYRINIQNMEDYSWLIKTETLKFDITLIYKSNTNHISIARK